MVSKISPFNPDTYANGLEAGLKKVHGLPTVYSRYGFIGDDGTWSVYNFTGCHSGLNAPIPKTMAVFNHVRYPIDRRIIDWALDKERSPWRKLFAKDFFYYVDGKDSHIFVIGDLGNHSSQLITSFCKAFRLFTEYPSYGQTFTYLIDQGVDITVAYFLAQTFSMAHTQFLPTSSWHGSVTQYPSKESLKAMLSGSPFVGQYPTYADKQNYYGVDSIWNDPKVHCDYHNFNRNGLPIQLQKELSLRDEIKSGVFARGIDVPIWNTDTIVKAARLLEKEYNIGKAA